MTNQLTVALRERLDNLEKLWIKGDAQGIVDQLYTAETQITGPGTDPVAQGPQQLTELVNFLVSDSKSATIRIDHTQALGKDSAYTWVTWEVLPKEGDAFKMKSLFVWMNTEKGWRLVADMYAEGEINF